MAPVTRNTQAKVKAATGTVIPVAASDDAQFDADPPAEEPELFWAEAGATSALNFRIELSVSWVT